MRAAVNRVVSIAIALGNVATSDKTWWVRLDSASQRSYAFNAIAIVAAAAVLLAGVIATVLFSLFGLRLTIILDISFGLALLLVIAVACNTIIFVVRISIRAYRQAKAGGANNHRVPGEESKMTSQRAITLRRLRRIALAAFLLALVPGAVLLFLEHAPYFLLLLLAPLVLWLLLWLLERNPLLH
jgi:hypothetical protein